MFVTTMANHFILDPSSALIELVVGVADDMEKISHLGGGG